MAPYHQIRRRQRRISPFYADLVRRTHAAYWANQSNFMQEARARCRRAHWRWNRLPEVFYSTSDPVGPVPNGPARQSASLDICMQIMIFLVYCRHSACTAVTSCRAITKPPAVSYLAISLAISVKNSKDQGVIPVVIVGVCFSAVHSGPNTGLVR